MSTTQKIIKYCAIAFAVSLIVAIFSGIIQVAVIIGESIFGSSNKLDELKILEEVKDNFDYSKLDIEIGATNITIKEGDNFKVETDNSKIKLTKNDKEINIKEKNNSIISIGTKTELIITIPKDYIFDSIEIEAGAGKFNIENLNAQKIDLDLGAGSVNIEKINAIKELSLEGGAGSITIKDANINSADIDLGVGKFTFTGIFTGNSQIESGVGETNINIKDSKENYKLLLEKGIGSIKVDNEKVENNSTIGEGTNTIRIEGGVGTINVAFTN